MPFTSIFIILILYCFTVNNCYTYNGTIAGNKSVSECINGPRNVYSDLEITPTEIIKKEGYAAEEHLIVTDDGYLLTLHRIPGPAGGPTVLLQHGLAMSAFDYVANGKDEALAFFLADHGYDVWLGNMRGTLYSRCHVKYTTTDNRYWNFSFHEMGIYDLPAQITYITNIRNDDLMYVGHSMGTTAFYTFAIERPDIASTVKAMFGLAPVAFLYYMKGLIMSLTPITGPLNILSQYLTSGAIFTQSTPWKLIADYGCTHYYFRKFCAVFLFAVIGFDAAQLNYTRIPLYANHFPSGGSTKTFLHYAQNSLSGTFRNFDYGTRGNLIMYNSTEPLNYNLSKIQVPLGMFVGDNDYLSNPKDVDHLYSLVPKKILNYRVKYPEFNHLDFLWGIEARNLVYLKLLSIMDQYR